MLNIKTQKNQSILIGDTHSLKVNKIDTLNDEVLLTLTDTSCNPPKVNDFTMVIGNDIPLLPDVKLAFITIGRDGVEYALLGFGAPRGIKIIGDWKKGDSDPGPASLDKLNDMHDESLVYYASMYAKTPLEIALFNRLKKCI